MKLVPTLFTAAVLFNAADTATASTVNFDFTGRLTVADSSGYIIQNSSAPTPYNMLQTPVSATLSYDTSIGISSSTLSVSIGDFWGWPAIIHDITTTSVSGNIINAQMLGDWIGNYNMPIHIQWDATGLISAMNYGLQVGDKLSGNNLYRDFNHDHVYDASELVTTLGSATPYSDQLIAGTGVLPQFYAPLAATSSTQGFANNTPFQGFRLYLDIGSGNSMYVTSVSSVPVPSALWLLGSGLLGLMGIARHKAA